MCFSMKGKHIIIDAFECDSDLLNNKTYLEQLLIKVAKNGQMKILSSYFYPFHPQGLTGMIVLASSHISIHTWPEEGYAALDIYTCGDKDPIYQVEYILKEISSKRAIIHHICRGITKPWNSQKYQWPLAPTSISRDQDSDETYFENKRDIVGLREILNGNHRKVFTGKSQFQNIQIVEALDLRMYLNGQLQFSSLDEQVYHEALVHPALTIALNRKHILVLGGGDGLALREVLKYPDVKHITLVELDPLVLDAAKYVSNLAKLNQYSLHDARVTIYPQDAATFLATNHFPYDVIIVDFPDPSNRIISDLYTVEFYSLLERSLTDDGVFVSQANALDQTPIVFWSIGKTIKSAGFQVLSYHTIVPSFGDWGFHIGSKKSILFGDKKVQVPHRTLPPKLETLASFSPLLLEKKKFSILNSRKNLLLHEIFKKESLFLGIE